MSILRCPNESCSGNVVKNGTYKPTKAGGITQKYLCKQCGKTLVSTKETFFYGLRSPKELIYETLAIKTLRGVIEGRTGKKSYRGKLKVHRSTACSWHKRFTKSSGNNNEIIPAVETIAQKLENEFKAKKERIRMVNNNKTRKFPKKPRELQEWQERNIEKLRVRWKEIYPNEPFNEREARNIPMSW